MYPQVMGHSIPELIKNITALRPRIIGIGGLFNDRFTIKRIITALAPHRREMKIVVGGNVITPIPEFMLEKLSADIGVIGEGELIFTDLVKRILSGQDYFDLGGLVLKEGDKIRVTGPGEYLEDLDQLPALNYNKIPMDYFVDVYKFYKNSTRNNFFTPNTRLGAVFTGRGCPYKCNFCYHFNKLRLLKIPKVISQIKELKERFAVNMIQFVDDLTLVNKKRALELCGAFIKENINLPYNICAHLNCLDEDMALALKESGCVQVGLGLESGSQRILDKINKGITIEQIRHGLDLLKKYRMNWNGSIQIGQLDESEEDVKETVDLFYPYVDELSTLAVSVTTPFPGTPLYQYGLRKGLIRSNEHMFKKLKDLRSVAVNFSRLSNWRIRYLRMRLTFKFDLRKQVKLKGYWRAYFSLSKMLINKILSRYIKDNAISVCEIHSEKKIQRQDSEGIYVGGR
jgi:radical SAM superfamily enzyme YgiQ (UPF0313 family)